MAMQPKPEGRVDRYPLNQNNAMIINMAAAYGPYLLAGHVPTGICWLYYTISNSLLNWKNVLGGIAYLAIFLGGFMMKVGYGALQNPDSPFVFPKEEFERGGYAKRIQSLQDNKI